MDEAPGKSGVSRAHVYEITGSVSRNPEEGSTGRSLTDWVMRGFGSDRESAVYHQQ